MKSKTCKKCGKVIEGYSQKHVDFLMMQHDLVHRQESKDKSNSSTTNTSFFHTGSAKDEGGATKSKEKEK